MVRQTIKLARTPSRTSTRLGLPESWNPESLRFAWRFADFNSIGARVRTDSLVAGYARVRGLARPLDFADAAYRDLDHRRAADACGCDACSWGCHQHPSRRAETERKRFWARRRLMLGDSASTLLGACGRRRKRGRLIHGCRAIWLGPGVREPAPQRRSGRRNRGHHLGRRVAYSPCAARLSRSGRRGDRPRNSLRVRRRLRRRLLGRIPQGSADDRSRRRTRHAFVAAKRSRSHSGFQTRAAVVALQSKRTFQRPRFASGVCHRS
jgi:hypothetical protein